MPLDQGQTALAAPGAMPAASGADAGAEEVATTFPPPLTPFVVWTASPTPLVSPVAPTLTPLPPATATPAGLALAKFMTPTTQNLTLMLLCFTFFTASGLGILGLITSVVYMRSQGARRREDDERRPW